MTSADHTRTSQGSGIKIDIEGQADTPPPIAEALLALNDSSGIAETGILAGLDVEITVIALRPHRVKLPKASE